MIQIMTALDTDHVRQKAIVIHHIRYTVTHDTDHVEHIRDQHQSVTCNHPTYLREDVHFTTRQLPQLHSSLIP